MERELWILGIAVAGPVIGSALGVSFPPGRRTTGDMLSFAGGAMLAISFLELLPESLLKCGILGTTVGMAIGLLTMAALEGSLPHHAQGQQEELERTSVLMILGIFLHNLPEGMAIASASTMEDPRALTTVAFAIAVHNIPEGICTSAPYYQATGRRLRAFLWSSSTALPMLGGYLLGKTLLRGLSPYAMGILVASVAGLMIHISCGELLPTALEQGGRRHPVRPMAWLAGGILFVMGLAG
ncbi:MAG: ZIP family metal transporter [Angelakisella sp.]|jgi:ZIP family zinc transporter|nr:ZIP family metal transporter [Angelakisella sp.]